MMNCTGSALSNANHQRIITLQKRDDGSMNGIMIQENTFARPSDMAYPFVEGISETPAGPVPRIKTHLDDRDVWGTIGARTGIARKNYSVLPGLYCVGNPDSDAPVLVTANYKLTFDTLRKAIDGLNVWILVLDTKGVNVWCAAGKGTFSTSEVIRQVKLAELGKVVHHRKLILPQLSATGVSGRQVKEGCGFRVIWGPIRIRDVGRFLDAGMKADPAMRQVTFTIGERIVLIPVELQATLKPLLWILLALFIVSTFRAGRIFLDPFFIKGSIVLISSIISGAIIVPILLPWIPGRAFSFKGALIGLVTGCAIAFHPCTNPGILEALALVLISMAVSSYLAMNFTGSTPFTAPSGVEKEMRISIPMQAAGLLIAIGALIGDSYI